ncbi:hypothetical protein SNE40_001815 [Patella caerulea]|uniref:Uncharacterized protein n=1 Tax=Patella caerulea TaxID=87958 RepID=A0AAN8PY96_PATCE
MGRLSSTVLRNNIGIRESLEKKASNVGASLSPKTKKALNRMENERIYQKNYKNRPGVKRRAMWSRGRKLYDFAKYKQTHSAVSCYKKGQLDINLPEGMMTETQEEALQDHSYTQ